MDAISATGSVEAVLLGAVLAPRFAEGAVKACIAVDEDERRLVRALEQVGGEIIRRREDRRVLGRRKAVAAATDNDYAGYPRGLVIEDEPGDSNPRTPSYRIGTRP